MTQDDKRVLAVSLGLLQSHAPSQRERMLWLLERFERGDLKSLSVEDTAAVRSSRGNTAYQVRPEYWQNGVDPSEGITMIVLETERLRLSHLSERDAPFILDLLNQPSFLQWIGDRGVRDQKDAIEYLRHGLIDSYRKLGFGLYRTALRQDDIPIGICGLLKREGLDAPDLGYALLPQYCSKGYALEAARAVLDHAWDELNLRRVIALVSPGNVSSIQLLEKLAFFHERTFVWPDQGRETELYALQR